MIFLKRKSNETQGNGIELSVDDSFRAGHVAYCVAKAMASDIRNLRDGLDFRLENIKMFVREEHGALHEYVFDYNDNALFSAEISVSQEGTLRIDRIDAYDRSADWQRAMLLLAIAKNSDEIVVSVRNRIVECHPVLGRRL